MSCQEQFDSLRASRTLEDEFIQGLIDKIKDMESKLVIEIADKERAEAGSKAFYNELSKVEKELKRIQSDQERKRYVLVLIDGDGLMFHDHLVSQAEIGGNKAGALLLEKVEKFVKELELGFEVDVVVKIYCNLKGMDKIYHQHGILSKAIGYDSFMRGLNKSSPSIDAIDAGNGKECADSKIHYNLSAAVANVQCKHIILGCSSDNGYARILTPLGNDPEKSSMISLLEGRPFAAELQALKSRFRTTEFKDIFRSEKWQAHRPPTGPSNLNGVHEVVNSKDSTKKPKTTKDILGDEGKDTTVQLDSEIVPRNRRGRRVDTRLEKVPYPLILEVKNRKYCNSFHLKSCELQKCCFSHAGLPTPQWRIALQHVARMGPCKSGLECSDPQCYNGHLCPKDGDDGHDVKQCRWREMHGVDQSVYWIR